jgi:hypothetical protein
MTSELEQQRRAFKRDQPELYAYITATEQIKAYDDAGDLASGALNGEQAASRVWQRGRSLRRGLNETAAARRLAEQRESADRP